MADQPLLLISDIPATLHSSDLRKFFHSLIMRSQFACFHFLHRAYPFVPPVPSLQGSLGEGKRKKVGHTFDDQPLPTTKPSPKYCCALVRMVDDSAAIRIISEFDGKLWRDRTEQPMLDIKPCHITRVELTEPDLLPISILFPPSESSTSPPAPVVVVTSSHKRFLTRKEKRIASFQSLRLSNLPELHPPPGLPQGNVGTHTHTLVANARQGILPRPVLVKLGISQEIEPIGAEIPPAEYLAAITTTPLSSPRFEYSKNPKWMQRLMAENIEEQVIASQFRANDSDAEGWDLAEANEAQDWQEVKYGREEREHHLFEEEVRAVFASFSTCLYKSKLFF
jgi:hypothetical protein